MTEEDDIDGLAAEYVLGSLDVAERKQVDARRKMNPALADAIEAWEIRLGPLSGRGPGIEPPLHLFDRIQARIMQPATQAPRTADVILLRRTTRRWRRLAIGAAALAAGFALVIVWLTAGPPVAPTATSLVAVLHKGGAGSTADEPVASGPPAFLVTLNLDSRTLTVYPVAARPVPSRSARLWFRRQGEERPTLLGAVSQTGSTTLRWPASVSIGDLGSATLAISLEAEGVPPGAVPGPIFSAGKFMPAP